MSPACVDVYIGLGSNVGDSQIELATAIKMISELENCSLVKSSSFYETSPEGDKKQPNYLNAVVKIKTTIGPDALLAEWLLIETQRGRIRQGKNKPRVLDLDLLLYGNLSMANSGLIVPHPRMHLRAFVLVPLIEIDFDLKINGIGLARCLLSGISGTSVKKLDGKRI